MSAPTETHYGVLGIGPRATPEQVDRAYRHAAGLYGEDSLATYSLLDMEERQQARERVEADRKSTRLNSSHMPVSRMPSSA